jgi:hypothetical protein
VIQAQTWLNILYLLLSFPLGVFYFVFLLTIFCTGVGLLPIVIGVFVIWAGLLATDVLADVDRMALNSLLRSGIPERPVTAEPAASEGIWKRMKATARRPGILKRVVYLFLRFPLGLASFVLVMILLPLDILLLTLPLTYAFVPMMVADSRIETFDQAIYLCCFGAVFTVVSVHLLNSWTRLCRRLGMAMLDNGRQAISAAGN